MNQNKHTLVHFPLEPLRERYTEYLFSAEFKVFKKEFAEHKSMRPWADTRSIDRGRVLDMGMRPRWTCYQVAQFLEHQEPGNQTLYLSDMFFPGIEGFRYAGCHGVMGAFCWAQTFDIFDFTNEIPWMRSYEAKAMEVLDRVYFAHELLAELAASAFPQHKNKFQVVGLPFDRAVVQGILGTDPVPERDPNAIVYSSRLDPEKRPHVLEKLAKEAHAQRRPFKFIVCSGRDLSQGKVDPETRRILNELEALPNVSIRHSLPKKEYFKVLRSSALQLNTALQDWVSFTMLEALTFGCMPLYPDFRSFRSTLFGRDDYLYDLNAHPTEVLEKIEALLNAGVDPSFNDQVLKQHEKALPLIAADLQK